MAMEEQSRAIEQERARSRWKKSIKKVKLVTLMGKNGDVSKAMQPLQPLSASAAIAAVGRGMNAVKHSLRTQHIDKASFFPAELTL